MALVLRQHSLPALRAGAEVSVIARSAKRARLAGHRVMPTSQGSVRRRHDERTHTAFAGRSWALSGSHTAARASPGGRHGIAGTHRANRAPQTLHGLAAEMIGSEPGRLAGLDKGAHRLLADQGPTASMGLTVVFAPQIASAVVARAHDGRGRRGGRGHGELAWCRARPRVNRLSRIQRCRPRRAAPPGWAAGRR